MKKDKATTQQNEGDGSGVRRRRIKIFRHPQIVFDSLEIYLRNIASGAGIIALCQPAIGWFNSLYASGISLVTMALSLVISIYKRKD